MVQMRLHSIGNFDVEIKEDYYVAHREECLARNKKWKTEHPERTKEIMKKHNHQHYLRHQNHIIEKSMRYTKSHPEQVKMYGRKHTAKRRKLGFDPLNKPFEDSEAHHIDFECVVYIPRELHVSIPHNVWTGRGMAEINDKVFEWLGGE